MESDASSVKPSGAVGMESMEEMERVFRRFDADGDGKISALELESLVRALGSHASPEEVQGMMSEMDSVRDGFVDLKDFADFHLGDGGGGNDERELRDAFEMYDLDRNGLISVKELHLVMKRMEVKCSFRDCSRMTRSVDGDGSGSSRR